MPGFGTWSKSIIFMVKTFAVHYLSSNLGGKFIFEFENILAPFWSCEVNFFFHGWMPNANIIVFVFAALQERHLMVQTTNDVTFIQNYAYT